MTLKISKTKTKPFKTEQQRVEQDRINALINRACASEPEKADPVEQKIDPQNAPIIESRVEQKKKTVNIKMMFALSKQKPSQQAIDALAQELYEWAQDEKSLSIASFCVDKLILHKTFMRWVDEHPILKYSYEFAIEYIGERREMLAMLKNSGANSSFIAHTLHLYNDDWAQVRKEDKELKLQMKGLLVDENKPLHITIVSE
jgi:hypothetical protein